MPIPKKVIKYLDTLRLKYDILPHRTVYTMHDKAMTLRMKPETIGKTLILKADKDLMVILIPGNKKLDKNRFKKALNIWRKKMSKRAAKKVDFLSEKAMAAKFKGVKVGAIPPLGPMWKLPTFLDQSLTRQSKIIINSGDYSFSIKISAASLKKLMPDAVVGQFSKAK